MKRDKSTDTISYFSSYDAYFDLTNLELTPEVVEEFNEIFAKDPDRGVIEIDEGIPVTKDIKDKLLAFDMWNDENVENHELLLVPSDATTALSGEYNVGLTKYLANEAKDKGTVDHILYGIMSHLSNIVNYNQDKK